MNQSKYTLFIIIMFVTLGIVSGFLGSELSTQYNFLDKLIYSSEIGIEGLNTTTVDNIINSCNNNTRIDNNLECVKKHVLRFYTYKSRIDSEIISFDTLMKEGGDCKNWAFFWEYIGKQLGYNTKSILIDVDDETAHRFSIISNEQGYCRVDQTYLDCFLYG